MTLREALKNTISRLTIARIPDARLDAEYLVAEAAGIPRLQLPLKSKMVLSSSRQHQLEKWTRERLERRPLSYVLGEQPFMHLTLRVNPSVLIPRPETELLVEEALRLLETIPHATVADVGTGSGNIALSLVTHPNVVSLHAIDISEAALSVARENALRNKIKKAVHWHSGDLLTPLLQSGLMADLIVANLPYIRSIELSDLSPELHWEPVLALAGGRDGLAYISQLIEQAVTVLKQDGYMLLEIGADQGQQVLNLLSSQDTWKDLKLIHDLAGHPRIIYAKKGALVGLLNH